MDGELYEIVTIQRPDLIGRVQIHTQNCRKYLFYSPYTRRSKVRFAPAYFLLATKNKPSARSLAPPFSQKVTLGAPVRLHAPSRRLAVATNFLRVTRVQPHLPKNGNAFFIVPRQMQSPQCIGCQKARSCGLFDAF